MSKTNCPNCGAAKETTDIRCPFCGTAYLDMTAIDLYSHEPMWLKFVGPDKSTYQIKVYPTVANFEMFPETLYDAMRDVSGRLVRPIRANNHIRINIEFAGVDDDKTD